MKKKLGWTRRNRERECSLTKRERVGDSVVAKENTHTHTHTDRYTKPHEPHATQSCDQQTLRPDHTHTEFDKCDLDSLHSTYNTRLDIGNMENGQYNNRYSYRTESRMEVNDVTAAKDVNSPPLAPALTHIPAQGACEVALKTSV